MQRRVSGPNSLFNFRSDLSQLEKLVSGGRRMIGHTVAIDQEAAAKLIADLFSATPTVVSEAEEVLKQREELLKEAKEAADKAKQEAEKLLADTAAKVKAEEEQCKARLDQLESQQTSQLNTLYQQNLAKAKQGINAMWQDAQAQAQSMVQSAQQEADRLVSEENVLERATREAEALTQRTQQETERIYEELYAHLDQALAAVDQSMTDQLNQLRVLRQQLNDNFE